MKVLRQTDEEFDGEQFSNDSPYTIMFGPDKCGETNKVHVIFQHQNPVTKEWSEHHLANPPAIKNDRRTHLYSLILRTDNTFDLRIDGETSKTGSLLEDFNPPVNPPEEIDDPEDSKPEDWVDEPMMADPEDTKPDDWDEDAPQMIVDEDAAKPDDWYDEESYLIADPEAEEPEDWDSEFDGDWEAPEIDNPKCQGASGCGPWKQPMIPNPDYKGPWHPQMIDNPEYKGEWSPRQIKNEAFFVTTKPLSELTPMIAVGIDIWTMQANIEFDNIYIGHSVEDAEDYAANTFAKKQKYEEEHMPKTEIPEGKVDDILAQITEFIAENYIAVTVVSLVGVFTLVYFACLRGTGESEESEEPVRSRRPIPVMKRSEKSSKAEKENIDESESDGPQIEEVEDSEEEEESDGGEIAGAPSQKADSAPSVSSGSNGVSIVGRTKESAQAGDVAEETVEDDEPALFGTSSTGLEEEEEAERVRQRRKKSKPRRAD